MTLTMKQQQHLALLSKNVESLTPEQFANMRALQILKQGRGRQLVQTHKLSLNQGEELWDFVESMCTACDVNRVILGNGSLDTSLVGIFEDEVIVRDWNTGKHFASKFTRDAGGMFDFSEPVEVRQVWIKADAEGLDDTTKAALAADVEAVEIKKGSSKWGGLLGGIGKR